MKLRLRKAKTAPPVVALASDDGSASPGMTGSSDSSSFSTATPERSGRRSNSNSNNNNHEPERSSLCTSSVTSKSTLFSSSFALTFPVETRFADAAPLLPPTPTSKSPKEPVWKKRLRHMGKSPPAAAVTPEPSRHDNELPRRDVLDDLATAAATAEEQTTGGLQRVESRDELEQVLEAVFTAGEVDFSMSALLPSPVTPPRPAPHNKPSPDTPEAKPEDVLPQSRSPPFTKSVSFDEAGLIAVQIAKKKSTRSRRPHPWGEEESFDELMRSHSEYSDIFTDIFEDEDFSLATPTIYTDDEEEEDDEVEDEVEDESTVDSYERRSRRKEKRRSEARRRRIKYEDEDEEEEDVAIGCQSIQVLEEFKVLTELFIQEQQCICVKPEDRPSPRRRRGRGRSRRSSRHPVEH
jgi:hypothetical protein